MYDMWDHSGLASLQMRLLSKIQPLSDLWVADSESS